MKKTIGWLIAVVVLAFIGFKAYSYWNSTYNGVTSYGVIESATKKKSKTSKGEDYKVDGQQYYYYNYEIKWVTKDGKEMNVAWDSREGANPTLIPVGTYVRADVSEKRFIKGPSVISKNKIPSDLLSKLE